MRPSHPAPAKLVRELRAIKAEMSSPEADETWAQISPVMEALRATAEDGGEGLLEIRACLNAEVDAQVRQWIREALTPDLSISTEPDAEQGSDIDVAGHRVEVRPAVFCGTGELFDLSWSEKRKVAKRPWRYKASWFFGKPQSTADLLTWPSGRTGQPLQFMAQIDLADLATNIGGPRFTATGLPDDRHLQIFVDLEPGLGVVDHVVLASRTEEFADAAAVPPKNLEPIDPYFINAEVSGTLPHPADLNVPLDEGARVWYDVLRLTADETAHRRNMYAPFKGDDLSPLEDGYRPFVPMARLGGYPVARRGEWEAEAALALGCRPEDMFLLLDMPVDPDDQPTDVPERPRIMILIETSRLKRRDFSRTFTLCYYGPEGDWAH